MKVLVTGATGLIGQSCIAKLLSEGYEVHAISSKPQTSTTFVRWHHANLLDVSQISPLIQSIKPTHLLHLAWFTQHAKFWTSYENLSWIHASMQLFHEFTLAAGQRIVAAGTCAEYDWSHNLCSEFLTPCRPSTLYGTAKLSTHLLLKSFSELSNISSAWCRVFMLFGPGENTSRLVPSVVNSLILGQPVLCSHGEQLRDFMYVEDVAAGIVALLQSNVEGAVNIASGEAVKLKEVVFTIADHFGGKDLVQLGAIRSGADEPAEIVADTTRLRAEVNFKPSYTIQEGIALTIESTLKARLAK